MVTNLAGKPHQGLRARKIVEFANTNSSISETDRAGISATTFLMLSIWIGPTAACWLIAIAAIVAGWIWLGHRFPTVGWLTYVFFNSFVLGLIGGLFGYRGGYYYAYRPRTRRRPQPRPEFPATSSSPSSHPTIANQTVSSRSCPTTQKLS